MENQHFTEALKDLLGVEGDFSNHPDDPGGKTRYGITKEVARDYGYRGPIRELPVEVAKEIYRQRYWAASGCDEIAEFHAGLAQEMFEAGVNLGTDRVVRFLQMGLNALNRQEQDWENIAVDGLWGPQTRGALEACFAKRGDDGMIVLQKTVNGCQLWHYLTLAQDDSRFESFYFGWVRHRI